MKNIASKLLLSALAYTCLTSTTFAQGTKNFIDPATPKNVLPFVSEDSVSKKELKKKWKLDFSDEFNDNVIDTFKWNIETSVKKRVDVTLYADKNQLEEKDGNMYIYYKKSNLHDSAYNAGRFTSKGKYAPIYGFLECRMHVVKPNGHQTAFWMMPQGNGMTNAGVYGTANDGA